MYNSYMQPQYDNDYQFYIDNLILLNYNKNKKSQNYEREKKLFHKTQ